MTIRPRPADWLTLANGVCGMLALLLLVRGWAAPGGDSSLAGGDILVAGGLVALGAACDTVDGLAARRWGSSGLGDQLDGLSDVVTFGVVPAVLVVAAARDWSAPWDALAVAVAAALFVCVALRLARHALAPHPPEQGFQGLPSPAGAAVVLCLVFADPSPPLTLAGVALVALLMLSELPYPHQSDPVCGAAVVLSFAVAAIALAGVVTLAFATTWAAAVVVLLPFQHAVRQRPAGVTEGEPMRAGTSGLGGGR